MDSSSGPPPFNFFGERLAEIIKKAIKQQMSQSGSADQLAPKLQAMIEQQQQTNAQLGHLVTAVSQLNERVQENNQRNARYPFWKKMALEVPPVVLAVLLAFGINSWWQGVKEQQRADSAVANVVKEIWKNMSTVEVNVEKNSQRLPKLAVSIALLKANPEDTITLEGRGIDNFELTQAAWQALVISNSLSAIDENMVMDAAEIYDTQLKRESRVEGYLSSLYTRDPSFFSSLNSLIINEAFIENFLKVDRRLLKLYGEFLEKYDHANENQPLSTDEGAE